MFETIRENIFDFTIDIWFWSPKWNPFSELVTETYQLPSTILSTVGDGGIKPLPALSLLTSSNYHTQKNMVGHNIKLLC